MLLPTKLNHPQAKLPTRANPTDAGLDVYSVESITIEPGKGKLIDTGIAICMGWQSLTADEAYVALAWDRSGMATKHNLHRFAGVVDTSYRGNLKIWLQNFSSVPYNIEIGDRIAQILIQKVTLMEPVAVDVLPASNRGESGFGSTGR